jgi:mitogen-activated protein kinase organizer 1
MRSCLGLNDSVIISGSEDGHIYVWDLLEGAVMHKLEGSHGGKAASAVAWNGGKKEWASAGGDGKSFEPI